MARKTGLSVTTVLLNAGEYKALMTDGTIGVDIETADLRGIADRYAFEQALKATNTFDFTVMSARATGSLKVTALDISVWSIGGTDYVGDVESGSIQITTPTEEAQGINVFDAVPNVVGGQSVTLSMKKMTGSVSGIADFTKLGITGSISALSVAVLITIDGTPIALPGVLKAAKHQISRGKIQMEDVTINLQGTPTNPASTTGLIGKCLLGDCTCTVDFATGGNEYTAVGTNTPPVALTSIIQKLSVDFARGQEVKISGTLGFQGAPAVI